MKILITDDSRTNLTIISASLYEMGHEVIAINNGKQAIELFKQHHPDLVILDVVMDGMDGFECARQIRKIETDDWVPIIFLSSSIDDASISQGIDAGGDDYLTKPFSQITLAAKIKAMQRISDMRKKLLTLTKELSVLSATDPLTGLYNRLQFDRSLQERISEADRNHHMIALMFIDLDRFKSINDTLGHHQGDLILKEVANRLKACLRLDDFVARLGGDEFAVIINVNDAQEAANVAKNIVDLLSRDYTLMGQVVNISASVGISFYPSNESSRETLLKNADTAMYKVKETCRNNYLLFTKEADTVS